VSGSLASGSAVTVAPAGILAGTGTVGGSVVLNGSIAPGPGIATLSTGAETWNGGGTYVCKISSTNSAGADRLSITGALTVAATPPSPFIIRPVSLTPGNTPGPLSGFNKFNNYTWSIATPSGGLLSFATNDFLVDVSSFANDFSGGRFAVAVSGNSLLLNYIAAPLIYPRFTNVVVLAVGGTQLSGSGGAGQAYVLLASTNLAPATWLPLATNLADSSGIFQFTDPQATNSPQRFYRLTSP
jgi:hypothetical protein